jgi:hypothetical protein
MNKHKDTFGFCRWTYSKDLKQRTCSLCDKTEPTPYDFLHGEAKRVMHDGSPITTSISYSHF